MEGVLGKWRKLSITADEEVEICIGDTLVDEGKSLIRKGLVGKLLTRRPYNKKLFKSAITRLWKVEGGFEIIDIAQDVYFFVFEDPSEIYRILAFEPWIFNRSLIILKEFEGLNVRDVGELCYTKLWVQVFNLPDFAMTDKIGHIIGDELGIAMEVDTDADGRCLGSFLCVRVLIDVTKPLRGGPHQVGLCIGGHGFLECKQRGTDRVLDPEKLPYGRWLRGELPGRRRELIADRTPSNQSPPKAYHNYWDKLARAGDGEIGHTLQVVPAQQQSSDSETKNNDSAPVEDGRDFSRILPVSSPGKMKMTTTGGFPRTPNMSPSKILFQAGTSSPRVPRIFSKLEDKGQK
ncbi:hypothetical protein DH2020_006045 [Rehmannia glutinosa]|uniref:DUF4283 domain-containing protein n=1 Tax=Rehmannia glutinosa TaxID=99300 RepID=A0ABR0XIE8_REHGL